MLHGRWGPCITLVKEFYRIPKDKDPAKLTFADVVEIIGGPEAYEQAVINAHSKKFGAKKGKGKAKAEPKAKAAKGKVAKVVAIKKPAKKVAAKAVVKTTVFKKAASKKTTPKRVIKATRKKAAKRK